MTGYNDDYERPFEVDPETKRKMSEPGNLPEWKEDVIWGENWEEPVKDPKYQDHWPSADFTVPTYIDKEDWW